MNKSLANIHSLYWWKLIKMIYFHVIQLLWWYCQAKTFLKCLKSQHEFLKISDFAHYKFHVIYTIYFSIFFFGWIVKTHKLCYHKLSLFNLVCYCLILQKNYVNIWFLELQRWRSRVSGIRRQMCCFWS